MAVYVDNARLGRGGKLWCHLVADSLEELHAFASRLGLRRGWFQSSARYPHYDVTVALREKALTLGAKAGDKATIVACARYLRAEYVGQGCSANLGVSSRTI